MAETQVCLVKKIMREHVGGTKINGRNYLNGSVADFALLF